LLTFIL
jgi:hypothetical protein